MGKVKINISTIPLLEDYLSLPLQSILEQEDLFIFTIFLPDFFELKEQLKNYLTVEEQNKAYRFYKIVDQNRFIIYRSILKIILAYFTQKEIHNLRFDTKANKKPYLIDAPLLHFNISHAEDYAVIAIAQTEVGVDIEYIDKNFDFEPLIPEIINTAEGRLLEKSANKKRDFYTSWTRKEALVKATGQGIDDCFQSIPTLDGQHEGVLKVDQTNNNWTIKGFEVEAQYMGAIAYKYLPTEAKNIRFHKFLPDLEHYFK
ncbi:4'-phosphopantetheinyl transferase family protein [Flavobacterium sp. 7A]|uniref:4'-phosphopantetheinyl transferase family protein n=1 Tax=Flavobacterium sp. 7A TaxID=2940571 RepID=UPI0022277A3E|nr:4'-phosphopantetheinyl transferase superfamily protein [Flavobacterium sp. 7A]MCW2121113.1 4'-phosphopantetheinyl transferase [Flavobacterium sp. 7A]